MPSVFFDAQVNYTTGPWAASPREGNWNITFLMLFLKKQTVLGFAFCSHITPIKVKKSCTAEGLADRSGKPTVQRSGTRTCNA